ncbi:TIGR00266 family protein [Metallosphaera tengchongensis]|uniref:TIGR00266 family protein n=1 Tax=Metallosphaera tengchongensis TaxID=1532350 RepID=A0A6N0NX35_9CREN|nr:TIGR00266 family protein [Metallosphaera tengchongensis]QKR00787.1 TIGR00266 family protein [Metallosphaera tengchongensis]
MPQYQVVGADLQYLKVQLSQGEGIYADAGHMVMKDSGVSLQTRLRGGFLSGLKRAITGGSFFVTEFYGPGEVVLSGIFPGKIVSVPMQGGGIMAESHSFLAAETTVEYDASLARLSAGILGGEGLFLARFRGTGNLFLHAYGGLYIKDLAPGETIQVEASHLMAFQEGMNYSVQLVGGLRSIFFSHEGLFFVTITGPGRVWLHTLTAQQLAQALVPFLPQGQQGGPGGFSINF